MAVLNVMAALEAVPEAEAITALEAVLKTMVVV